jgi:hypothetical protein
MGAQTDQLVKETRVLVGKCSKPVKEVMRTLPRFLQVKREYDDVVAASAKRVTDLTGDMQWMADKAPKKFAEIAAGKSSEDLISSDSQFKALDKRMNTLRSELESAMGELSDTKRDLTAANRNLNLKITAFERFVDQKDAATLNPFKKKSVRFAREVISIARRASKTCQTVLNKGL